MPAMKYIVVGVLFGLFSLALSAPAQCFGACQADADCGDDCPACIRGKCGVFCGGDCKNDTQCTSSGCEKCAGGICTAKNGNHTCGSSCHLDSDCPSSHCSLCIDQKQCGQGCGSPCAHDSECWDPYCRGCNKGKCGRKAPHNVPCGKPCTLNDECVTECSSCIDGTHCGLGCNQPCTKDEQCGEAACPLCLGGSCWHN
eukprot:NODE_1868_length_875_cov_639.322034_g1302_i0.p1 GENE.NODE_1868_length_875_cov_639.322034_g1302_i0~~NODE_1868_length_875_cov_639.322034_g1302_i0.p1  ORF type:complete len:217 (+),score=66.39 NODE_1868_length_875_cov_639.322034_g1302_i0:55-651(+)